MQPRTLSSFGAPYEDETAVANPSTELAAALANQQFADHCQLTRMPARAYMQFQTRTTNGAVTIARMYSLWGNGSAYNPTSAQRTATGLYAFTWTPGTFEDDLGADETVSFRSGWGNIADLTVWGGVKVMASGATATVKTGNSAGSDNDLGGSILIDVWLF